MRLDGDDWRAFFDSYRRVAFVLKRYSPTAWAANRPNMRIFWRRESWTSQMTIPG
jgi:hypothetical protein